MKNNQQPPKSKRYTRLTDHESLARFLRWNHSIAMRFAENAKGILSRKRWPRIPKLLDALGDDFELVLVERPDMYNRRLLFQELEADIERQRREVERQHIQAAEIRDEHARAVMRAGQSEAMLAEMQDRLQDLKRQLEADDASIVERGQLALPMPDHDAEAPAPGGELAGGSAKTDAEEYVEKFEAWARRARLNELETDICFQLWGDQKGLTAREVHESISAVRSLSFVRTNLKTLLGQKLVVKTDGKPSRWRIA